VSGASVAPIKATTFGFNIAFKTGLRSTNVEPAELALRLITCSLYENFTQFCRLPLLRQCRKTTLFCRHGSALAGVVFGLCFRARDLHQSRVKHSDIRSLAATSSLRATLTLVLVQSDSQRFIYVQHRNLPTLCIGFGLCMPQNDIHDLFRLRIVHNQF
jgi:hypothetical protein